ncbi:MAG: divalent-cation tolerance protein CutA [Bacteroidota bacterium]
MDSIFIYITCKDKQEALDVGKALLSKKLVACINIIEGMTSAYWWEGEIVEDTETILIAKSKSNLIDSITETVKTEHSYDIPCVIGLPIQSGNQAYLNWISESVDAA